MSKEKILEMQRKIQSQEVFNGFIKEIDKEGWNEDILGSFIADFILKTREFK